jgi:hypothetical protein
MNYKKLKELNPTVYDTLVNTYGQRIELVEHPTKGDEYPVIAICHELELAEATDFFDTDDMLASHKEYEPIFKNDKLIYGADWTLTDPDNDQYGLELREGVYLFKEKNHFHEINDEGEWIEIQVNLKDYSEEKREEIASMYYGSLDELKSHYGDNWEWILAECIFEQESGLY